jgi:hypothetical protein
MTSHVDWNLLESTGIHRKKRYLTGKCGGVRHSVLPELLPLHLLLPHQRSLHALLGITICIHDQDTSGGFGKRAKREDDLGHTAWARSASQY